ncbi:hypothetical protein BJ546DRAFT_569162 [Cryomyces antarcticus]
MGLHPARHLLAVLGLSASYISLLHVGLRGIGQLCLFLGSGSGRKSLYRVRVQVASLPTYLSSARHETSSKAQSSLVLTYGATVACLLPSLSSFTIMTSLRPRS